MVAIIKSTIAMNYNNNLLMTSQWENFKKGNAKVKRGTLLKPTGLWF